MSNVPHQSLLPPADNKFHQGNGDDGKHYWLTPGGLMASLNAEFSFDFDPCPFPKPEQFDGLTCEWGKSNYVNPPFGSIIHDGKKKGPTAWVRKAIEENAKGKRVVLVYPIDKWVLMLVKAGAEIRNLGDVRWCATEDGSPGKGSGRTHRLLYSRTTCRPGGSMSTRKIDKCQCGGQEFLHKQFTKGYWVSILRRQSDGTFDTESSTDEMKSGKEPRRVMCLSCGKYHPNPFRKP
jgi:hypothetical protein